MAEIQLHIVYIVYMYVTVNLNLEILIIEHHWTQAAQNYLKKHIKILCTQLL